MKQIRYSLILTHLPAPARSPSLCSGNSGREGAANGGQANKRIALKPQSLISQAAADLIKH